MYAYVVRFLLPAPWTISFCAQLNEHAHGTVECKVSSKLACISCDNIRSALCFPGVVILVLLSNSDGTWCVCVRACLRARACVCVFACVFDEAYDQA